MDSLPDTLRGRDALAFACGEKIGGVLRGGFSRALLAACGGSALRASGGGARVLFFHTCFLLLPPILICHKNDCVLRLFVVPRVIVMIKAIQSHLRSRLRLSEKRMADEPVRQIAHCDM